MRTRPSPSAAPADPAGPAESRPLRRELLELVGLLSEPECAHLLHAVRDVAEGERFWEDDFGRFYHEYVKLRSARIGAHLVRRYGDENPFVPRRLPPRSVPGPRVALPAPDPLPAPLGAVLAGRRSRREYGGAPLPLATLSSLLHHAAGVTGSVPAYDATALTLRSFPSHGGLQSQELYVAARDVAGLPAGVYHHFAPDHVLEQVQPGDVSAELETATYGEQFVGQAAAVLVLTADYERLRWKYGERAYRFACIDAGFLGENLYLVAEALGLCGCAVSGFAQDDVDRVVDAGSRDELAFVLFTLGLPER